MEPLSQTSIQRLERLFKNATSSRNHDWNPDRIDSDVINAKTFINICDQRRRARANLPIDDRIILNVSGIRYETHRATLEFYPNTLLGNTERRKYYYDETRKEYFFDRHRGSFEAILYYYQSRGRLRRPDYIPLDVFLEEITFFELGQAAFNQLRKDENIEEVERIPLPKNPIRKFIWATIEYPAYSLLAKFINVLSLVMILLSTIILAIESLPQYTSIDDLNCQQESAIIVTNTLANSTASSDSTQDLYNCPVYYTSVFFLLQSICMGFFTLEFLLRLFTTPKLCRFLKNLMNWIDLIAIIPFYVAIGINLSGQGNHLNNSTYISLQFLRIVRLVRVLKFFRLFKSVRSLRVLAATVRQSLLDFLIMIIILTLLGFLFGAAAYYAEKSSNQQDFDSIPKATYWGIITITSVGYGDVAPTTTIGRCIASLCALFGAATIGMLVSVLVDRYQRVYSRKLYLKDEIIDFDQHSDDEKHENDINHSSLQSTCPTDSTSDTHINLNSMNAENDEVSNDFFEIHTIPEENNSAETVEF